MKIAALLTCENGSWTRTRKGGADNNETNTLSQDTLIEQLQKGTVIQHA